MSKSSTVKSRSKGERLNWTPINNVVNVKITRDLVIGKSLSEQELHKRRPSLENNKMLVY